MVDSDSIAIHYWMNTAAALRQSIVSIGVNEIPNSGVEEYMERYDAVVLDENIRDVSRDLFCDGHYAQAVQEAYKFLEIFVREKTKSSESGVNLMRKTFKPDDPILRFNSLRTETERNEQRGYMEMLSGSMAAIRNPRSHEILRDDPSEALEMLTLANHLIKRIKSTTRTRKRRKRSK